MSDYELTVAAEEDLLDIARYTINTWGIEQARRYDALLEKHFKDIAAKTVRVKQILEHRPELLSSRCEHHYIFHIVREGERPLILAIFHERMHLMDRLRERLES